ncbi:FxsA family protein [Halomonas campisalis]|uniref:FxsA family protein n=1 Tax=Billgrantia campisalis TaxID=74661 RepID=A0ABS9PB44_9GAMM|nr:FxsA family protein [Halomonas campisalis]MCG6658982.1 FxsA family protein [Halomonas campisalis]MDR5863704.1 FxsA family protein [Halomonas campisalis]
MPFLLLFTLFALLDFVILFTVGSRIGLLTTLLLILATGFIGLYLIRREGTAALARARLRLDRGELPSGELLTGAALIFGGALLLAPGFLSDTLGFLCVIPGARRWLARLLARVHVRVQGMGDARSHGPADDWQQASGERGAGANQPHHDAGREQPLEGDFIGRDETRR